MTVFCILTARNSYRLINMHYERLRKPALMENVNTNKQDSHMVTNIQNPLSELSFCGMHHNV
jgi:hypothetical protein